MTMWEKIKAFQAKYILILFLFSFAEGGYITYKELIKNENASRLDNIEFFLGLCGHVAQAETVLNKKILHSQGLYLYHCNNDKNGNPKFSFMIYKGVYYPARNLTSNGIWEFQDRDEIWHPIVDIKEMK